MVEISLLILDSFLYVHKRKNFILNLFFLSEKLEKTINYEIEEKELRPFSQSQPSPLIGGKQSEVIS